MFSDKDVILMFSDCAMRFGVARDGRKNPGTGEYFSLADSFQTAGAMLAGTLSPDSVGFWLARGRTQLERQDAERGDSIDYSAMPSGLLPAAAP